MLKGPLVLASLGLGLNLFLGGIPGMVAVSSAAYALLPNTAPPQSQTLDEVDSGPDRSLYTALARLIGAESEALQVAGAGLQQPPPVDLAPRADAAGAHVVAAAAAYIRAAQAVFSH